MSKSIVNYLIKTYHSPIPNHLNFPRENGIGIQNIREFDYKKSDKNIESKN